MPVIGISGVEFREAFQRIHSAQLLDARGMGSADPKMWTYLGLILGALSGMGLIFWQYWLLGRTEQIFEIDIVGCPECAQPIEVDTDGQVACSCGFSDQVD